METSDQANERIGDRCDRTLRDRYRLVTPIDEGAFGTTYEAEDLTNYHRVAIKALSLQHLKDRKVLESFEREANVLASLNHSAIPKYLDYFHAGTPTNDYFYLVHELIDGESLADLVKKGWHPNEQEIKGIAIQILECLEYLHSLEPPAIHRDIKPQNIIRRWDGKVFLVNFGTVQEIYRHTFADDSTFVGTLGYIPPEQYNSQVKTATDIYALGATLLFLLTHKSPDEFPQHRLKIEFRDRVNLSAELADVLEKMLEPFIEERFESATEVLEVLKGDRQENNYPSFKHQPPSRNPVRLNKTNKQLIAEIPPAGWASGVPRQWQLGLLLCGILFGGSALGSIVSLLGRDLEVIEVFGPILPLAISLVCLGILLFNVKGSSRLEINEQTFQIQWKLLGYNYYQARGKTRDIRRVELISFIIEIDDPFLICCTVIERMGSHQFGMMLESEQKQWLVEEISDFLTQLQPTIDETDSQAPKLTQPRGSHVVLQKTGDRLIVDIPPTLFRWYDYLLPLAMGIFVAGTTSAAIGPAINQLGILKEIANFFSIIPEEILIFLLALFSLLLWMIVCQAIASTIYQSFAFSIHLEINRETFRLEWRNCLGTRRQVRGKVANLQDVFVADCNTYSGQKNEKSTRRCILVEGTRKHSFGSRLRIKEQSWLVGELAEFLGF